MRKGAILTFALSAAFFLALTASGQPPGGDPNGDKGGQRGKGGFGMGMRPGQILPTFLQDRLKLSDEQKEQIAALQKDVDAKVAKILTDDQNAELKKMREQGPGGFPGGRPGGPGGKGGPPNKN